MSNNKKFQNQKMETNIGHVAKHLKKFENYQTLGQRNLCERFILLSSLKAKNATRHFKISQHEYQHLGCHNISEKGFKSSNLHGEKYNLVNAFFGHVLCSSHNEESKKFSKES